MGDQVLEGLINTQIENIKAMAIRYAAGDQEDVLRQYNGYIGSCAVLDGRIEGAIDMLHERLKNMYAEAESDLIQGFYNAGVKAISEYRSSHFIR